MIDGIPIGLLGYGSGWAIVAILVIMLFRGDIITKRESAAKDRQIEALGAANATQAETIASFKEAVEASTAMIAAVLEVAKERAP